MKKYILLFIILFFVFEVFAISPITESIVIRNFSSKTVIITRDYQDDPSKIFFVPESRSWSQDIHGINLTFRDLDIGRPEIRVLPNQVRTILEYYPWAPIDLRELLFLQVSQIPFMEKMNSIFKYLRIATEDNSKIITLENLGDQIIKKNITPGGISFIIEIFDYDLIGRPGSEW
jgi:hypothetical protein